MKSLFAVVLALAVCGPVRAVDTPERAIVAAMKLSEQSSYTWSSVVVDDASTYDITGKVKQNGYTWVRLPLTKAMARRLGRRADPQLEAVFDQRGDCVVRTDDGWRTLKELPKRHRDWYDQIERWPAPGLAMGTWGVVDPEDPFYNFPPILPRVPEDEEGPYSNAQFGVSYPHEELGVIVTSCSEWTIKNDVVSGRLTDIGAQLLLVRDNQDHIKPLAAAGIFKLLVKDGLVTKYIVRLEGLIQVGRKKILVRQTSTTVLSDIGTTKLDLPEAAVRKLEPFQAFTSVIGR